MLNKLTALLRRYEMVSPGDTVICAVSGGADSMALLWAMYLLKDKLGISLAAAHFNHRLRQEESDRDEAFVRDFCRGYGIPLYVGSGRVTAGKKGLEAAAREARYAFLDTLPGKTATAHTADDNAETLLMHLIRGTALKGLGGISPVRGNLIRPMLTVTRQEVLSFLAEYHLDFVEDSSNQSDAFLRNRLRHHVMPLLAAENPRLAENLSGLAMKLRADEQVLAAMAQPDAVLNVNALRQQPEALRGRTLAAFLERSGVREAEAEHIALAEKLVFSEKPSARGSFPGGITVMRNYDTLSAVKEEQPLETAVLDCPGSVELHGLGLRVICEPWEEKVNRPDCFTVNPVGTVVLRHRLPGDTIRLNGGTKAVKKLFIDRRIPAGDRLRIPVLADDAGILGVFGIGADLDRAGPGMMIRFEEIEQSREDL